MRASPRRASAPLAAALLCSAALILAAPADAAPPKPSPRPTSDPAAGPANVRPGGPVGGKFLGSTGLVVDPAVLPTSAPLHLPTDVQSPAWIVADLDSGAVLAARDPHGRFRPASTLKELTATTLLPHLAMNQQVTFTKAELALATAGTDGVSSLAGLAPGSAYSVEQLFYAMLLPSGNDAAEALAATYPGGRPAALAAMNAEAKRLQADDTTASTPDGLDADGQFSSPYDLALIARAGLSLPDFATIVKTRSATLPCKKGAHGCSAAGTFAIQNHNHIVTSMPGALGVKNGYTTKSKQVIVGAAEQNGHRIVAALMDCDCADPFTQTIHLLQWGFRADGTVTTVGELVAPLSPAVAVAKPGTIRTGAAATAEQPGRNALRLPRRHGHINVPLLVVGLLIAGAGGWVVRRRRAVARARALRLARQHERAARAPVSHRARPR